MKPGIQKLLIIAGLAAALGSGCSDKRLEACITAYPSDGVLKVGDTLYMSICHPNYDRIVWYFGNGDSADGMKPSVKTTYAYPGYYVVQQEVHLGDAMRFTEFYVTVDP